MRSDSGFVTGLAVKQTCLWGGYVLFVFQDQLQLHIFFQTKHLYIDESVWRGSSRERRRRSSYLYCSAKHHWIFVQRAIAGNLIYVCFSKFSLKWNSVQHSNAVVLKLFCMFYPFNKDDYQISPQYIKWCSFIKKTKEKIYISYN